MSSGVIVKAWNIFLYGGIIYLYATAENSVCNFYRICIKHLENKLVLKKYQEEDSLK